VIVGGALLTGGPGFASADDADISTAANPSAQRGAQPVLKLIAVSYCL
jgi:hypothetical protein